LKARIQEQAAAGGAAAEAQTDPVQGKEAGAVPQPARAAGARLDGLEQRLDHRPAREGSGSASAGAGRLASFRPPGAKIRNFRRPQRWSRYFAQTPSTPRPYRTALGKEMLEASPK